MSLRSGNIAEVLLHLAEAKSKAMSVKQAPVADVKDKSSGAGAERQGGVRSPVQLVEISVDPFSMTSEQGDDEDMDQCSSDEETNDGDTEKGRRSPQQVRKAVKRPHGDGSSSLGSPQESDQESTASAGEQAPATKVAEGASAGPSAPRPMKPHSTTRPDINVKPFACTFAGCTKTFHWMNSLQIHALTHSNKAERKFACEEPDCGQRFYWASKLKAHSLTHTAKDVRPYTCKVCSKAFKQKSYLKKHSLKHSEQSEEGFACEVPDCTKQFPWKENLQVHMLSHSGKEERRFACEKEGCGKTFFWASKLQIHMLTHAAEKNAEKSFPCNVCNKRFAQRGYLAKHLMVHINASKSFACVSCDQEFTKEAALNAHMATHGFAVD